MQRRHILWVLPFALAGCFDIDFTADLSKPGLATATVNMAMDREIYDFAAQGTDEVCPAEDAGVVIDSQLTETEYRCTAITEGTIAEFASSTGPFANDDPDGPEIEQIAEDVLRISIDFDALRGDDIDDGGMLAAIQADPNVQAMMAGRAVTFRVRGVEILESTGEISEGGTTATRAIPLIEFLNPNADLGPAFVTLVRVDPGT